jgi:hypothetical protein
MRVIAPVVVVLAVLVTLSSALAQADSIRFASAWARRAPAHGHGGGGHATHGNGAVYVTITNRGAAPDAVVGATSDAAEKVELHETRNEGGVMKMHPMARVEIAPGGQLEMKPGGYHIMLLGLKRDLKAGERVTVTLTFEKAGPKTVEADVR